MIIATTWQSDQVNFSESKTEMSTPTSELLNRLRRSLSTISLFYAAEAVTSSDSVLSSLLSFASGVVQNGVPYERRGHFCKLLCGTSDPLILRNTLGLTASLEDTGEVVQLFTHEHPLPDFVDLDSIQLSQTRLKTIVIFREWLNAHILCNAAIYAWHEFGCLSGLTCAEDLLSSVICAPNDSILSIRRRRLTKQIQSLDNYHLNSRRELQFSSPEFQRLIVQACECIRGAAVDSAFGHCGEDLIGVRQYDRMMRCTAPLPSLLSDFHNTFLDSLWTALVCVLKDSLGSFGDYRLDALRQMQRETCLRWGVDVHCTIDEIVAAVKEGASLLATRVLPVDYAAKDAMNLSTPMQAIETIILSTMIAPVTLI